jgi:hypothetical protein
VSTVATSDSFQYTMPLALPEAAQQRSNDGTNHERHNSNLSLTDSLFQLPIRRQSTRQSNIGGSITAHHVEVDSSSAILTPEGGSSDEEETEASKVQEPVVLEASQPTWKIRRMFLEAIKCGDINAVKAGLNFGIEINHKMSNACTPLVTAIIKCQFETARFLLKRGANVHQRVRCLPPIHFAALRSHSAPQLMQLLMDYGAIQNTVTGPECFNTLHFAAMYGKADAVRFLIKKGMDMERTCLNGRTPLILAAEKGNTIVARALLAMGAKLYHRSLDGKSALGWAACNNHLKTVEHLLKEGIDVNDRDDAGDSKFHGSSILGMMDGQHQDWSIYEAYMFSGLVTLVMSSLNELGPTQSSCCSQHAEVSQL